MKRTCTIELCISLLTSAAALLLGVYYLVCATPAFDIGYTPLLSSVQWAPLASLTHNAYHLWRADPVVSAFSTLSPTYGPLAASTALFFLGCCCIAPLTRPLWLRLLLATFVTALMLLICGRDSVLIGSLTWMPLLFATLHYSTHTLRKVVLLIVLFALSCRVAASANQLSVVVVGITLALFFATTDKHLLATLRTPYRWMIILATTLAPLIVTLRAPVPVVPHYPEHARVVPSTEVPGLVRPLVGPDPGIEIINRPALRGEYCYPALFLLLLSSLYLLSTKLLREKQVDSSATLALFFVLLSGAVVWDVALPEAFSRIGPLAAISRMIAGLFYVPLAPLTFTLCWIVALLSTLVRRTTPHHSALALLFGIGACFDALFLQPLTLTAPHLAPLQDLDEAQTHELLVSPSLYVIINSPQGIAIKNFQSTLSTEPAQQYIESVESFPPQGAEAFAPLFDHHADTRFVASRGGQMPGRSLFITFKEPFTHQGLLLDTGAFFTDFPRGIEVRAPTDCSSFDKARLAKSKLLFSQNPWIGPLRALPSGYPYYDAHTEVRLRYATPVTVKCVIITQTGSAPVYDWSIAELSVLKAQ